MTVANPLGTALVAAVRIHSLLWRALGVMLSAGAILSVTGCDPPVHEETAEDNKRSSSVVPLGRSAASTTPERLQADLESFLSETGGTSAELGERLDQLPARQLWDLLSFLSSTNGEEGKRVGLAMVILGELSGKDPAAAARYLADAETPFGVAEFPASILPFRQAMTQWASEDASAVFQELRAYEKIPHLKAAIDSLTETHGERLEVTLAGAMPLTDLGAVTERWNHLQPRESAGLLTRLLQRLASEDQREALTAETALWLQEQWQQDGPGVLFQWALGLNDDALLQQILSRVNEPEN